ncbi:MAG TPA: low specificity L-threonine aldolase [Stellaceae bacterium]|nr:low specificity L-threonine aldolase [Stellaceae bacterium]
MNFASDNVTGIAPEILAAIDAANRGAATPYGADEITRRLEQRFAALFEREVAVFPVATGTAANALALACVTPAWGAIYCHEEAHIATDECGAPEFFTAGAKLVTCPGEHGKLTPGTLEGRIAGAGVVHQVQPAVLSITQETEAGTVYRPDEIAALSGVARQHGLALHMDGARFANAVAGLNCSPAAVTWRAGVDVLSFGATKNGALAAEAVVFFDPAKAADFGFRRKRAGHLVSKQRFIAAQLEAYLADDLWLRNARHANAMATRLGSGLACLPGTRLLHPIDGNEIFIALPEAAIDRLAAAGFGFYRWGAAPILRLVTAFDTELAAVEAFLQVAGVALSVPARP